MPMGQPMDGEDICASGHLVLVDLVLSYGAMGVRASLGLHQCPSIAICSRASACTVFPVRSTYSRLISAKKKRLPFETKYWCHAQLHHQTSSPCTAKQLKERWSMSNKSSLSPITSIIACSWPDQADQMML
jgi:hypothetical protein